MLVNIIQNTISSFISAGISVITTNLKMWLGFKTSETIGKNIYDGGIIFGANGGTFTDNGNGTFTVTGDGSPNVGIGVRDFDADYLTVGGTYKFSAQGANTTLAVYNDIFDLLTSGVSSVEFQATTARIKLYISPTNGVSATYSDVEVKELTQITPDKSGNNNVGELFTGKALEFDGATEYVDISGFTMSGNVSTFAFWINSNDTLGRMIDIDTNRFIISFNNNQLSLYDGSWKNFGTISTNVWNRCVIVTNGTSAKCYVNGVQLGVEKTINAINIGSATTVIIGAQYQTVSTFFDGKMSDFQIYNAAWTTDDIAYDYANPNKLAIDNPSTSLSVTNLKGYWALSEGDGKLAYDSGTNLEEEEVQNGTFELGSEIADNNTINNDNGGVITKLSDLNYNATSDGTSSIGIKPRILPTLTLNKTYKIVVTPRNQSGTIRFNIYDGAEYLLPWENGFTEPIVVYLTKSGNTPFFSFNGQNTFNLDFTLSVKEVPNWVLGDGWSIANDVAIQSGGVGQLSQTGVLAAGKSYSVSVTIDSIASGTSLKVSLGSAGAELLFSNVGATTLIGSTSSSVGNTILYLLGGQSGFSGSISNVSVREVTASDHGGLLFGADYVDAQPRIPQLGMQNWSKGSNLFPYSEDFTEWVIAPTTSQVVLAASEAAPYGQGDVYSITMLASESDAYIRYATDNTTLTSSTHSVWVKQAPTGSATHIRITNNNRAAWNTGTSKKIALTSSWQRLETTDAISGNRFTIIGSADVGGIQDSDCIGKALIYGAQLLEGSAAGVYRFTDGAATSNSTVIANPTIPTQDIFGNLVRDRLNSFNLDGSGYAEVADDTDLDFGTGDFTLECWAKYDFLNQGSGWNVLVSNGNISSSGGSGFSLASSISNFSIRLNAGTAVTKSFGTDNMTVGNWYHLVVTREGTSLKTYRDTSLKSLSTIISVDVDTSLPVRIGRDTTTDRFYQNLISDVRLYDRALSSDEIENNYNAGLSAHTND